MEDVKWSMEDGKQYKRFQFNKYLMGVIMNSKTEELLQRVFNFGIDTLKYLFNLPKNKIYDIITFQLAKASTSSGSNYEEAQAAESKKDFIHKVGIVLKEIRESNYWLRILYAIPPENC